MDIIEGLHRIKRVREDIRESELRQARGVHESAARRLEEARNAKEERDGQRDKRRDALYADVMSRQVVVRELDDLRAEMELMKEAAVQDARDVEEASAQRDAKREAMRQAAQAMRLATQAREKFSDLLQQQRLDRIAEQERAADLELEGFAGRQLGADFAETMEV